MAPWAGAALYEVRAAPDRPPCRRLRCDRRITIVRASTRRTLSTSPITQWLNFRVGPFPCRGLLQLFPFSFKESNGSVIPCDMLATRRAWPSSFQSPLLLQYRTFAGAVRSWRHEVSGHKTIRFWHFVTSFRFDHHSADDRSPGSSAIDPCSFPLSAIGGPAGYRHTSP